MDIGADGPFVEYLGLELTERTGGQVVASWTAGERHHQPYGIVHGGVHASVVETLGSVGSAIWAMERYGEDVKVVGVNNSTDFLRAVSEGPLVSTGTPIHQGRSQQLWLVETRDADGRLIARGQLRVQNLHP
jgi:1,4-dihydroxy-2-naphthoyl-CoA hydrolase